MKNMTWKTNKYDALDKEIDEYRPADKMPKAESNDGNPKQLYIWWAAVIQMNELPWLSKLIKSRLCIFSGPMVEQPFR